MKKKPNTGPVTIAVPNTIDKKMDAIILTSKAILEVAKALNSVHVDAFISNCNIENSKGSGIQIG